MNIDWSAFTPLRTITRVSADFATSGQIAPEQLAGFAAAGFKSVINNRPDGEGGETQPTSEAIESAARAAGLRYAYLPVVAGKIAADEVEAFAGLLARLPKPVLAFCRTGTRSRILFQRAGERGPTAPSRAAGPPEPPVLPAAKP